LAAVALADVHENAVRSVAEELVSAGHRAIAVRCDVADEAEVAAMVEQTVSTFGRLDAAFNNAGVQSPAVETADASGEEFDRVNAINLRGVWNCMKYELHQMREQGSGAIVNCSSIGGLIGIAGRATYHASKHGVIGLTKSAMPYLNHVPVMTGGVGREEIRAFYAERFIPQMPPDAEIELISRTVGQTRIVDEFIFKCIKPRHLLDRNCPSFLPNALDRHPTT
jgi:NAD(P)-dependent dehydrogenase (short-subunit alcohol dehydrogenase family)